MAGSHQNPKNRFAGNDTILWHSGSLSHVIERLGVDPSQGLSASEAAGRLEKFGPNELIERGGKSVWRILGDQLGQTLVVILLFGAAVSVVLGDYNDAAAILVIVVLNAALGARQEYNAEQAIAALKKLAVPSVKVRRGGRLEEISSRLVAPGDVVLLEAGNRVPADGRLIESVNLRTQEAALTGESAPVEKELQTECEPDAALAERRNMVFMGTAVTYGRGAMVATGTGMASELGKIAHLIQGVKQEPTPLQRRLDQLGKILVAVALGVVGVIFVLGLLRGEEIRLLFLTAVSLAVAAVPEGLPAVVTIALALGAQRLLRRQALIRSLPAVETLGSVSVICSDKTGTLTHNEMRVAVFQSARGRIDRDSPARNEEQVSQQWRPREEQLDLTLALLGGALCNDAVPQAEASGEPRAIGDPTEVALVVAAAQYGLSKHELEKYFPRVAEVPFDSERKRMTTVHRCEVVSKGAGTSVATAQTAFPHISIGSPYVAFTKGAMDRLLGVTASVWRGDHAEVLDETQRKELAEVHDRLAQKGMRVLATAFRPLERPPEKGREASAEQELILLGMFGIIDPPRPEAKRAVETCRSAGIRPVMITGDHPLTAREIAKQVGIESEADPLTGADLDRLEGEKLEERVSQTSVFARVSPAHKLRIVEALQKRGHVVAMTGDGVNDAPALKKADIGVAMGITGTDVAKEAADMVLRDDNFATIVAAVEEGRVIFDNIRKFIKYLLAANSGEIWAMLAGPLLGMPLPLLPLQILWMNLITDGPPALALGVEPAEKSTMQRPPYPAGQSILAGGVGRDIVWIGLLMGLGSLAVGYFYWQAGREAWQTMIFTTLTLSQMTLALAVRSERESLFRMGLLSNKPLLGAIVLSILLQLAAVYVPFLQAFLGTHPLSGRDLALAVAVSTTVLWVLEIEKAWKRRSA